MRNTFQNLHNIFYVYKCGIKSIYMKDTEVGSRRQTLYVPKLSDDIISPNPWSFYVQAILRSLNIFGPLFKVQNLSQTRRGNMTNLDLRPTSLYVLYWLMTWLRQRMSPCYWPYIPNWSLDLVRRRSALLHSPRWNGTWWRNSNE